MISHSSQSHFKPNTFKMQQSSFQDPKSLENKSYSELKTSFNQWIRSLLMEQRFLAVKIYAESIPKIIRNTLLRLQTVQSQRLQEREEISTENKKVQQKKSQKSVNDQKIFFDSIIFVSDGQQFIDHICFDYCFLNSPESLFDLLMNNFQPNAKFPLQQIIKTQKSLSEYVNLFKKCETKEKIYAILKQFLRQEVMVRFLQRKRDNSDLIKQLSQQKKRKKQFSSFWKYASQQQKYRILLNDSKSIHELYLKLKLNKLRQFELEKEINELRGLEKNQFCNKIFKFKYKKYITELIDYYEVIYYYWKNSIQEFKKKKYLQREKKVKKHKKINSEESNETNQTEFQHKQQQKQVHFSKDQFEDIWSKDKSEINSNQSNQIKKQCNSLCDQDQLFKYDALQFNELETAETITFTSINPQSNPQIASYSYSQQYIKSLSIEKISEDLQELADKISEEANQLLERRVVAFERIQCLLYYYNIPIKLFGSCANGIAVKNSDIDIAVDNTLIELAKQMTPVHDQIQSIRKGLQILQQVFRHHPCFVNIKLIKTAAIPVIKMTVDTRIPFLDMNYGQIYAKCNKPHQEGTLQADITVQTLTKQSQSRHMGIITTKQMKKWLQQIPSLYVIIIVLKQFFMKKNLNVTYEGGMNTFSMMVLLVAYIYHAKLEKQTNSAVVLEKILKFYAYQFKEQTTGINISNREQIYYKKNSMKNGEQAGSNKYLQSADLQMKDPMNTCRNMTRNCYKFGQIKEMFGQILNCYKMRQEQTIEMMKLNEKQMMQNQKKRNLFIQLLDSC